MQHDFPSHKQDWDRSEQRLLVIDDRQASKQGREKRLLINIVIVISHRISRSGCWHITTRATTTMTMTLSQSCSLERQ